MYWVRRRSLPKGRTTPGDMLQRMDRDNKHAILGNFETVDKFDVLTKPGGKYHDDPQAAVRLLLSGRVRPPKGVGKPNR